VASLPPCGVVPPKTDLPLRFPVGSLAESLT